MDYNKLLEKARKTYSECVTGAEKRRLESIFPELRASEDDKMINALIEGLYDCMADDLRWSDFGGVPIKDLLAWLEKQGEQKSTNICW